MDTPLDSASFEPKNPTSNLEFLNTTQNRHKTALRLRYESEARVILRNMGGLEGARKLLGLSQRKICQLLLVDPSAWTRWGKDETKIPPHVVRSLQWYLTLESKDPAWGQWREMILKREPDPQIDRLRRDLESKFKTIQNTTQNTPSEPRFSEDPEVMRQLQQLKAENELLTQNLERHGMIGVGWKLLLLVNSIAVGAIVLKALF